MKHNSVMTSTEQGRFCVQAPFNPTFVGAAKLLGGNWNSPSRSWQFDPRSESGVRELLKTTYGTDTIDYPSAMVRIDAYACARRDDGACYFAGRKIMSRKYRDTPVRLGDGVVLVEGKFLSSGGSVRNPRLEVQPGTVIAVYDVPMGHPDLESDWVISVVPDVTDVSDGHALRSEREQLMARVAEIDALLSELAVQSPSEQ